MTRFVITLLTNTRGLKSVLFYLRRPSDHVFDKVSVSGGIYYSYVELGGLKLPKWDIYCDPTLPLSL